MQTLSFHHGCVALAVGLIIGTMPDAGWAQASRGVETRCPPQCGGNYSSSRSGSSNQGGAARDAWLYESIDNLGKTLESRERAARMSAQQEQEERQQQEDLQRYAQENAQLQQQAEQWRNDGECNFDKVVGSCSAIYRLENIVNDPQRINSRADLLIRSSSPACSRVEYFVDATPHQSVLKNTDRERTSIWGTARIDNQTISIKSCRTYARKSPVKQQKTNEFAFDTD